MNKRELEIIAKEYNLYSEAIGYCRATGVSWASLQTSVGTISDLISSLGVHDNFYTKKEQKTLANKTFTYWKMYVK